MTAYSEIATVSDQQEKFLPPVPSAISFTGATQYFLFYLTNTSGASVGGVSVTLETDTPGADTLALAKVPTIDTDGDAVNAPGYTYAGVGSAVTLGDVPSGSRWGVWVRRVIPEDSPAEASNTFRLKIDTAASVVYASGVYEVEPPLLIMAEAFSLGDAATVRVVVNASESVTTADTGIGRDLIAISVSEATAFSDEEQNVAIVVVSVEESMTLTALRTSDASEGVGFSDAAVARTVYMAAITEGLSLGDAVAAFRAVPVVATEGLGFADVTQALGAYAVLLDESLSLSDAARVNEILSAYVYNTVNTAVSTYKGYNFNSFALIGGKHYGADLDGGVYELAGADDDGAPVDATITLPTDDLSLRAQNGVVGAGKLKRCEVAYLGYTANGDMFLRVDANGNSNTYSVSPNTTPGMRTGRILLGKGVSSRYWDFTLGNLLGAEFEIESITFVPVVLGRRVTEY